MGSKGSATVPYEYSYVPGMNEGHFMACRAVVSPLMESTVTITVTRHIMETAPLVDNISLLSQPISTLWVQAVIRCLGALCGCLQMPLLP